MPTVVENFINLVYSECLHFGIKVILKDTTYIREDGQEISGYFSAESKELVVAKNNSSWEETLIHEFCHFKQWSENCEEWSNLMITPTIEANELFDLWLKKEIELSPEQLKKYIDLIIDLELDCEKRTVEMIRKYNLPVDTKRYIKKANVYLRFYKVVEHHRKWTNEIIYIPKLWKKMPGTFKKLDYYAEASFEELAQFDIFYKEKK